MKSWLHSISIVFMLTGYCYGQGLDFQKKLPGDWRNYYWQERHYSDLDFVKLEKKFYADLNVDKIHIFKKYRSNNDKYVLAFGPFETRQELSRYLTDKEDNTPGFDSAYDIAQIRKGYELDDWYDVNEHGEIHFSNLAQSQGTPPKENGSEAAKTNKEHVETASGDINSTVSPDATSVDPNSVAEPDLPQRNNIQKLLKRLKLYNGRIDGEFGPGTKRAIRAWQKKLSEVETGFLTEAQLKKLLDPGNASINSSTSNRTAGAASTSNDLSSNMSTTVPPAQTGSGTNTTDSGATPWPDAEVQELIADFANDRNDLIEALEELKNNHELELDKANLKLFQTPIEEMVDWKGKLPARNARDITVKFKQDCLTFVPNQSLEEIIKNLGNQTDCMLLSEGNEINTDETPSSIKITNLERQITLDLYPSYPLEVSSIVSEPSIANFDIYGCAFNLLFTNSKSASTFEIEMLFEGDGRFKANETINDILAQNNLDPNANNWNNLKVQVTKSQDKGTTCKPQENAPVSIKKDKTNAAYTISREGQLHANEVKLDSNMDDLIVFLSNNIGRADDGSGTDSFDPNYPFSRNLDLQTFYFTHALDALQRYTEKPDAAYRSIKIYKSIDNTFIKKVDSSLPNKNTSISHDTVFNEKNVDLDYFMPDVARFLRSRKVADSTAILVIGSFGLGAQDLCDHSLYASINRSRSDAAVYIFNFVPFENFSSLDYELMHAAPATLQCPDKDNIFLIYPNKLGQLEPPKIADGFYKLISERFRK